MQIMLVNFSFGSSLVQMGKNAEGDKKNMVYF